MKKAYENLLFLVIGLFIYSIFHVIASYGYKYLMEQGYTFRYIFMICLLFGTISYIIKIPLFYNYAKGNTLSIYIIYLLVLTISTSIYSKFILNETFHNYTYIILLTIVSLVIFNEYLNIEQKK